MKLTDKWNMNKWAYVQCKEGNDTPEMRNLITESYWSYLYCISIKDREEMWRKITRPSWAYYYCEDIKDRPEFQDLAKEYEKYIRENVTENRRRRNETNG